MESRSEHRIFRRSGSGLVDRNNHRGNAVSVPCDPECCHGEKEKSIEDSFTSFSGKAII